MFPEKCTLTSNMTTLWYRHSNRDSEFGIITGITFVQRYSLPKENSSLLMQQCSTNLTQKKIVFKVFSKVTSTKCRFELMNKLTCADLTSFEGTEDSEFYSFRFVFFVVWRWALKPDVFVQPQLHCVDQAGLHCEFLLRTCVMWTCAARYVKYRVAAISKFPLLLAKLSHCTRQC